MFIGDIEDVLPSEACHKCGKVVWTFTDEPYTWSCSYCGNIIYLTYGALRQQIDFLMSNPERRVEFVKSIDGGSIRPKKNEELKRIRFDQLMEDAFRK